MRGHRWAWSVLLLGLAGCTWPAFLQLNYQQSSLPGNAEASGPQFIAGSVETVSDSALTALRRLGITAVAQPEGERVVLHCTTRKGTKFALILERWPAAEGVRTRVDFAWEGTPEDAVRLQVAAALLALAAN